VAAHVSQHTVVLDRPYFLLLQDVETGTPLFLSRVVDPRGREVFPANLEVSYKEFGQAR
jgi:serine protease inhibitor